MLIVLLFLFLMNQVQGGGGRGVMQFAKSKAKLITKDMPKTTFSDVAGCDEAIEELGEIKEFLQEPAKFQAVGAKIPKGVLLYGPPGTGKTLLARAVAGEAGVPFYSISGSDFVEMFVGVGASRVRDLFEQAKENAPAIVFIDEIDAVGRHRGAGMGGGHDEREQTLNQLLVEMDGFDVRGGVILIAATNRPDVLDPALLRPGRFDRQIQVDAPDLAGRHQILKVHSRGKPMAPDIDLLAVARRTPGFTGADLANVLNEAALLTARNNQKLITNDALDEAIDRVIAGPQRRTRLMSEKEKLITAYHEGGHALVAAALPGTDPVHKITILPRGRALGYTMVLPDEDKYSQTRSRDARQARLHAGRPGRGGDGLPRPDHRRRQRHREGHGPGPGDGHPVRHDRAARRDQARREQRRAVPRPRHRATAATTPRTSPRSSTRRPRSSSPPPTRRPSTSSRRTATSSTRLVLELLDKETLDKERGRRGLRAAAPARRRGRPGPGRPTASRRTIPPVEIPQEIRDRVDGQRHGPPTSPRRGAVLTPPGAGGDVHGDPGRRPARPTARPSRRRRRDRPDRLARAAAATTSRRSTTPGPRPPSASC